MKNSNTDIELYDEEEQVEYSWGDVINIVADLYSDYARDRFPNRPLHWIEAANYLNVSPYDLRNLAEMGEIAHCYVGLENPTLCFTRKGLDEYIDSITLGGPQSTAEYGPR